MSKRQGNQLPNNIPQLQNLIKRDPESYREEFDQQLRHFNALLRVFELSPGEFNRPLEESVMFMAQVTKCYPDDLAEYLPRTLFDLLRTHSTVLDPDMRMSFCKALILLRHRDILTSPGDLLRLFFDLLKCRDKPLRKFLKDHIVTDLKNLNAKHKDVRLNSTLQNFMFSMLKDSHKIAAKTSLDVMIELYKKDVWRDPKTVNVITTACFSDITKISVTAMKFFLGKDEDENEDDSDDDDLPAVKDVALANKVNKRTKKREKFLENVKKAHRKKKKKEKAESFNFSALHLIHDPQGFAERLFKKLDALREKFEVKLLFLDLISRLIGTHQLFVLNYYPYIARFLNPHQREVIQMLQFAAQAAHDLVPPDAIEPVLRAITHNFITERNSAEVMAIGLNAMRELCRRCPLAIDETLLRDLAQYKSYKDKGVMMAAKSLIQFYRVTYPELLHKKDRGRPTEAIVELKRKAYGEHDAVDFIPGAEALDADAPEQENENEDEDEDDWENISNEGDEDEGDEDENDDKSQKERLTVDERRQKASEVATSRILTDADFRRIDSEQLKKQVLPAAGKNKKGQKRKIEEVEAVVKSRDELVDLANIEMVYKKRKHDKASRVESIMEGRENREKYGSRKGKKANEKASTSNKEKIKKKNFAMIKHKLKFKVKRSFVQKQKDLKKSLIKSRKFK